MAAAIRVRIGNITRNYVQGLLLQSHSLKSKHRVCFHNTSFLSVVGQELKMPSLSPTMSEGTIVKWLKKEGDPIQPGDVLCDIQTDKAVVSFETEEEGILAKILVKEDAKDIKVGTVIALMVAEGEDWKSVEGPSGAPSSAETPPSESAPRIGSGIVGQELKMPSLSPTMSEGTIVKWLKNEGDPIAPGDVLCDIQTDKAVVSFETEEEGVLAKILIREDAKDVKVGTTIALMVGVGEDWKNVEIPSSAGAEAAVPSMPPSAPSPPTKAPSGTPSKLKNYGPAVHFLLELYQLQSSQVTATGRNGKLLKLDVLKYVSDNRLTPKPPKEVPPPAVAKAAPKIGAPAVTAVSKPPVVKTEGVGYADIELSGMRKTIAKRLTESKTTIPHAYGVADCVIDNLLAVRKQLKEDGIKLSVNDFVIKAVALALQQCPQVNALQKGEQTVYPVDVDISVAVATDAGLITPIVKAADAKGLEEISSEVQSLAKKAREGKLQPHEFQGGTFTISNLGMFGVDEFSAIINPPQCGILAIGTGRLVLDDKKPVTKMKITLSYDGRAIDEKIASEFLDAVKEMLEDPSVMLLGGERGQREKLGL